MNNFENIKEMAVFRWEEILPALGIFPQALNGKHQACQGCSGKDRFRYVGGSDGKWFCSQGFATTGGDGFDLLCHVFGWSKGESLKAVAEYLGVDGKSTNRNQKVDPDAERWKRLNIEVRHKREEDKKRKLAWDTAQSNAEKMWDRGISVIKHPYLTKKQIQPVNIRQHQGALLIPMYFDGKLVNIHRIFPDGKKRFLIGGRVTGCWMMLGDVSDHYYIVEGFATGCTVHEKLGVSVVVAFSSWNLDPVARGIRKKYPDAEITIAADNDIHTVGNAGLTKARKAALAVGGNIIYPDFTDVDGDGTDFNDYVIAGGSL